MDYIIEMALSRADAIEECISKGNKFVEHFRKLYKEPDKEVVNHWCGEMQAWYDKIKGLKFKHNNKPLLDENIRDWFFTMGQNTEDFLDSQDEIEFYDKFIDNNIIRKSFILENLIISTYVHKYGLSLLNTDAKC